MKYKIISEYNTKHFLSYEMYYKLRDGSFGSLTIREEYKIHGKKTYSLLIPDRDTQIMIK